MRLSRKITVEKIITSCFVLLILCGVLTYVIGHISPLIFASIAALVTLMVMIVRIPGINLMLNQQAKDTGSTVAIIQFFVMMSGALGMMLVSLHPDALILNLAMIQFGVGIIVCSLWLFVRKNIYVIDNLPTFTE